MRSSLILSLFLLPLLALGLAGCIVDALGSGADAPVPVAPAAITLHCPAAVAPACPDPLADGLTGAQQLAYCPACPAPPPCEAPEPPAGALTPDEAQRYIRALRDAIERCAGER